MYLAFRFGALFSVKYQSSKKCAEYCGETSVYRVQIPFYQSDDMHNTVIPGLYHHTVSAAKLLSFKWPLLVTSESAQLDVAIVSWAWVQHMGSQMTVQEPAMKRPENVREMVKLQ